MTKNYYACFSNTYVCTVSSADSFETMLKSLLGYQSGSGVGVTESVIRKKVYEGAINKTLENNFPLLLQVCSRVFIYITSSGFHCLDLQKLFSSLHKIS